MPEIGEVARIVHYLRQYLVNKTIKSVLATEDDIVYGKVGCSAKMFEKAMTGRKVLAAKQQGKYFYLEMDRPPHPLMHFGMTGWMHVKGAETAYHKKAQEKEKEEGEQQEWPPRFMKFLLETTDGGEVAFVDARRLARIRLIDCPAEELRNTTPLKENGPDPVIDKDILTVQWLTDLMNRKKVPIKALLLDQANISGVGNWVADEVLYQAKIHPLQYCNTFTTEQITTLHGSLTGVCTFAVECLADSTQFPETWLMKYRWDKGKKGEDANVLPNGEKIVHIKAGGRTSAIVPSVQKITGAVAGVVGDADLGDGDDVKPKRGAKRKLKGEEDAVEERPKRGGKRKSRVAVDEESEEEAMPAKKKRGSRPKTEPEEDTKPTRKSRANDREDSEEEVMSAKKKRGSRPKTEPEEDAKPTKKSRANDSKESEEEIMPAKKKKRVSRPKAEPEEDAKPTKKSRANNIETEQPLIANGEVETQENGGSDVEENHAKAKKVTKSASNRAKAVKASVPGERRSARGAAK